MGLTQLFADSNANTVALRPVFSRVQHEITVGLPVATIQPLEDVIQFQTAGKLHPILLNKTP